MVKIIYENIDNNTIIITISENITIFQDVDIRKSEKKLKINVSHILFTSSKISAKELRNKLDIIKNVSRVLK